MTAIARVLLTVIAILLISGGLVVVVVVVVVAVLLDYVSLPLLLVCSVWCYLSGSMSVQLHYTNCDDMGRQRNLPTVVCLADAKRSYSFHFCIESDP